MRDKPDFCREAVCINVRIEVTITRIREKKEKEITHPLPSKEEGERSIYSREEEGAWGSNR